MGTVTGIEPASSSTGKTDKARITDYAYTAPIPSIAKVIKKCPSN